MLTLGKEADGSGSQQLIAPIEQLRERRQRSRGHDIHLPGESSDHILDAGNMNTHRRPCDSGDMPQERAFARIALDQIDRSTRLGEPDPENKTWKPSAGSEIQPSLPIRRQVKDLERVGDMPHPDLIESGAGDEVLRGLPPGEFGDEKIQFFSCFT